MAQLVQHLPRTQKIAGSSPAQGSSGVVACICLVSITDYSCMISARESVEYGGMCSEIGLVYNLLLEHRV